MFRSKDHPEGATLSLLIVTDWFRSDNVNTLDIITILLTLYLIKIIYITDMLPQNQDYITKAISN